MNFTLQNMDLTFWLKFHQKYMLGGREGEGRRQREREEERCISDVHLTQMHQIYLLTYVKIFFLTNFSYMYNTIKISLLFLFSYMFHYLSIVSQNKTEHLILITIKILFQISNDLTHTNKQLLNFTMPW